MPDEDPATPPEEPTVGDGPAQDTAIQAQQAPGHEPAAYEEPPAYEPAAEEDIEEGDEWLEEPDELPHRPRRRLLERRSSAGAARRAADRVRVHRRRARREGPDAPRAPPRAPAAASLASRFAALRGGAEHATLHLHERSVVQLEQQRRLCPADRRDGGIPRREHAVCDQLRRQHRQGHNLGRHDREQDRESERQRHPPRRNGHRHRRHRLERRCSAPNRSASARAAAVWRRCSAARARDRAALRAAAKRAANHRCSAAASKQMSLSSG